MPGKGKVMNIDPVPQSAPYEVSPRRYSVSHQMATTAFELPNFRVLQNLGVVRGIVVRSRNVIATLGAAFQQVVGGNITIWTRMCEETRRDAFEIMIQHASEIGANAIIGMRYDTTEISTGVTEVLAYGTAVIVEPTDSGYRA
jgi:uncharacterized protein YbjQ (UPF0145 family)